MGHEFRYRCPVETRGLLWFVGIMFVVIVTFQHFELPYNNIITSKSSVHTNQIAENGTLSTDGAVLKSETVSNVTQLNVLNSTDADNTDERGDNYVAVDNETVSEESVVSNKSSLQPVVQPNEESTQDPVGNSDNNATLTTGITSVVPLLPAVNSSSNMRSPSYVKPNTVIPVANIDPNTSSVEKHATPILEDHGNSGKVKSASAQTPRVVLVSEMHNLLLRSWSSPSSMRPPQWASPVDRELLRAKSQIENAPIIRNDPLLYAPLYWNISMFKRSYELMEEMLKVYIYKEGEKPILHQPVLKGIYASEGWFMKLLEANKKFVTKKPRNAHLFYLPFSSRNLELQLYVPDSHSHKNLIKYLKNYLDLIVAKYPFWNRTDGVDHFLVACHDWAASETKLIMSNCIRALCNADVKEGFVFGKDASLPETNVRTPQNPLRDLGGKPPSKRPILAFFAGSMHGYLRPILLEHWGNNKDPDMKIYGRVPKGKGKMNYFQHMKSSKYCICARGYEVNSPRIVEAIMYECVPVIISDNYVPPFFEVLNWESFAVFVLEKDIPNLKSILVSIPEKRYREMQMRVKKVQQHFLWHGKPVKYDMFHMILHSVWYNRVFQMQPT
ncbi:probable glycosyltransferase At5g03795 [Mercurialis annua]|uniref:probable glycosyltransferase At5g03795 n=1 Tax=Mercurialis annua TaxID=3986 RepID=UPI0024AE9292|nr:probable glycosyltransferase At5g03795 [Mercurialis annua]XP_055960257.1 probable glycosyltransferase At5g03795 [Mercurialis annua]XP_055960258.1 probable glycosyltransferase At5g03795 [Mercurialis annua]